MHEWLNASLLPPDTWIGTSALAELRQGPCAELYADGQLKHFASYVDGSCAHGWAMELKHGQERGKVVIQEGSGGTADYERYSAGKAELFDAWSDNAPARTLPYREWVLGWIARITQECARRVEQAERARGFRPFVVK